MSILKISTIFAKITKPLIASIWSTKNKYLLRIVKVDKISWPNGKVMDLKFTLSSRELAFLNVLI